MTVKEYLQQIYHINGKIMRLKLTQETIRADLYSVRSTTDYTADRVQTSVEGDAMAKLVARADEITRELLQEMERLTSLRNKIRAEIEQLPNEKQRTVLYRRYVLCERWEQIAESMNVSTRYVYMVHGNALQSFAKKYSFR